MPLLWYDYEMFPVRSCVTHMVPTWWPYFQRQGKLWRGKSAAESKTLRTCLLLSSVDKRKFEARMGRN